MRRLTLILVVATFLLGACSWSTGADEDAPTPIAQPTPTERMTLDDLGLASWPQVDEPRIPPAPERPRGVEPNEYLRMIKAVKAWALQAAIDPRNVGEGLPGGLASAIDKAVETQAAPALARGNVLDPELEVGSTRMTAAWEATEEDGAVHLSLQTRTAYEVTAPGGEVRVIGVLRTQGVVAAPDADEWGTIMGWQEFGAADCAIALDDFLTPGGDPDDQLADLAIFTRIGNGTEPVVPELADDQRVDEEFARGCKAGRA